MKSAARPRTFAPASTPVRVRARVRANPSPNPDPNPSQATHLRTGEQPGDRPVASGHRAEGGEGSAPLDECERAVNANYSEARAAERLVSKPITRRLKLVGTYVSG